MVDKKPVPLEDRIQLILEQHPAADEAYAVRFGPHCAGEGCGYQGEIESHQAELIADLLMPWEYGLMFESHFGQTDFTPQATVMSLEDATRYAAEPSRGTPQIVVRRRNAGAPSKWEKP